MCGSLDVEIINPTSNSVRRKVINNRYIEPLSMQEPNPYAPLTPDLIYKNVSSASDSSYYGKIKLVDKMKQVEARCKAD